MREGKISYSNKKLFAKSISIVLWIIIKLEVERSNFPLFSSGISPISNKNNKLIVLLAEM